MPAFSCFRLECSDGSYECSTTSDISANLECAPHALAPAAAPAAAAAADSSTLIPPSCHTATPHSLAATGARPPQRPPRRPCCRWALTDCRTHPEARCVATQAHTESAFVAPHTWISPPSGLWLRGSTRERPRKSLIVPRRRVHVYASPFDTNLQVVQRSLSGGFLREDAALLNANVRSMFDEAGRQASWEGRSGREPHAAQGGSLRSQAERPQPARMPVVSCGRLRRYLSFAKRS